MPKITKFTKTKIKKLKKKMVNIKLQQKKSKLMNNFYSNLYNSYYL